MSERAPYSRVYWSVLDDPKFVGIYDDDSSFALWTRLLISADALWPAPAPVPRTARAKPLAALVKAGLIDLLPGDRYKVHGLDAERGRRREAAKAGGKGDPAGTQTGGKRDPNGSLARAIAETSRDEHHQDEPSRARDDLWSDPEGEALTWLARHGCHVQPGNGYHQKLVTAVERHGVNAIVGMFDRLAEAGTRNGDLKGFLFPAIDALDARTRPDLKALEAEDRAEEREGDFQRRLQRTRERTAELRQQLESQA